jgi:filamentous hemagglutinin family protein
MSIQRNIQKSFLMGSTALTRPAATLGAMAAMVLGSGSAFAIDANTLPSGGTVTGGAATISQSGSRLDVNQSTNRTVLDWRSFDIGENAHVNFNQPNSGSIAVNRINQSTNPTQINGQLTANGHVWVLNPNGVMFGASARVDVSGLVASTANINVDRFMAGDTRLDLLGAGGGSVVNEGQITVREGGLAAFVAPHVRNNGTIRAKVGKVAMAAGETFTLDLAGDRLIEIGLGADGAKAEQLGQVVAEGGVIEISAKAATQVVDSIVNVEGITSAASATVAGGEIILGGGEVNVAGTLDASGATGGGSISIDGETITTESSAVLKADATDNGDGGSIIAYADGHGDYAGSFSAKGGANGGDGGFVETSGKVVKIDGDISVNTLAPQGSAGNWTIDPDDLAVIAGLDEGSINPAASFVNNATIVNQLATTGVTLAANNSISVDAEIDSSGQSSSTTLALNDEDANNDLTINLNAAITLGANQTLTGEGTVVNVNNGTSIQNGVDVAANGAQLNVGAGAYGAGTVVSSSKTGLTIDGGNVARVDVANGEIGFEVRGNGTTISGFEIAGPVVDSWLDTDWNDSAFSSSIGVNVTGATGVTITGNNIHDIRTGMNFNAGTMGSATNNYIENTKGGILSRPSDLTAISGNTEGPLGNEWGIVLGLGAIDDDAVADATRQGELLAYSTANNGMSVFDRGYGFNNRTHIFVDDDTPVATIADDFGYGNGLGNERQPLPSLQAAVNGVVSGGWIFVGDGNYTLASTLDISKSLTLTGTSQAGTVIDASGIGNAYAIQVEADNVDLNTFTLIGSPTNGSASYGIKVQPDTATVSDRVLGFSISDVTVQDSYRTALDLHAVDGATINNFTALNTAWGNGITLTDSANVTITNSTTTGNVWGGLALYQRNAYYDLKSDNISIDATNTFNEDNPVYAQQYTAASQQFGDNITIEGFSHTITNPDTDAGTTVYSWFQRTLSDAVDFALAVTMPSPDSAVIEGWDGSGGDGQFYVGSNGVSSMSIFSAVNAAESGDTVNVLEGTYTEDQQIVISKNLSILGDTSGNKPVITPGTDYTGNNAADAWFLVNDGVTFALSDVAIDGTGYNVWQALRSHGNTTVTNVDFSNIAGSASGSPYRGIAIEQFGGVVAGGAGADTHGGGGLSAGHLTVTGSTFSDIGRIGVLIKGTQATSDITGNTFTGKGTGDFLDYGIEVGASGQATITGNTISGNRGVAASDGSGSAGILVTSYYGGASSATIENNVITDNSVGVHIGYDGSDVSNVTAEDNDLSGNDTGVALTANTASADFSGNWWGSTDAATVAAYMGGDEAASIDFSPFLLSGTDTDNGTAGFQGDFASLAVTNEGGQTGATGRIQEGINLVDDGGTVNVRDGNYLIGTKLLIDKALTLAGQSRANTIIDATGVANYGIDVRGDNVTLRDFTTRNATTYGVKVSPATAPSSSRVEDFNISNVTIENSGRTELDLNGVDGATIDNVLADGNDTWGVGIAIGDSANVTVTNSSTTGNDWGGVALYQNNTYYDQQTTGINIDASNSFAELNPVYLEDESATNDFGTLNIAGFDFAVRNPNGRTQGDGDEFTWLQATQQEAIDFAMGAFEMINTASSSIQGWTGSALDGIFTVGTSTGGDAMSIQAAVDAASDGNTINVLGGTYDAFGTSFGGAENLTIQTVDSAEIDGSTRPGNNRIVDLRADGTMLSGFNITSDGGGVGISVSGIGITASGNTITDVLTGIQTTTQYAAGNGTFTGNTITGATVGVSLQNAGNNVSGNNVTASTEGVGLLTGLNTFTGNTFTIGAGGDALNFYAAAVAGDLTSNSNNVTIAGGGLQNAIHLAGTGGTLDVGSSTYAEDAVAVNQINVTGNGAAIDGLTLNGAGSTIGGTFNSAVSGFTFGAPVILSSNLALTTTGTATITTGAINAAAAGAQTLTVNAGGTASFGSLGGTTRLGATSITGAGTTLTGANYNANSLTFGGPVTLTQALTSFNSTISGTQAGNITFTGNIFGTANGAQSLNLIAGNGAGAKSSNGDVSIQNAGTQAVQLGGLTVNADDFSAATVWLAGDYNGTMTGNQTFTDETLNAGGNVSSTVGGNASGPINSGGNVNVNSGGNVSGNVSGNNVTLAGQNVNSNVTANQTANITAQNSVSGNVSAGGGGTINAGTVNTNLSGGSFTVNASGGSVTGNPSGLNTTGSGSLKVNGQTVVGSSDADFNQIVVEGFTLPAGATVTDTGEIVLPQGLAIGLISPAAGEGSEGTAPRVIFVRSVQRLGALLAEGYSAIVIDLNEGVSEEEQEMAMAQ